MRLLFVVNPVSGGVEKDPFLQEATSYCAKYGVEAHIFKTTGQDDAKKLLQILDDFSPDRVASVGGDGTALFTAVHILNTSIPMGLIPLGSANGLATELGVSPRPIVALQDLIISRLFEGLDMLLVNDEHYSIHIGDVGINAKIVEAYENDTNRGLATYAKYFIRELGEISPFDVEIECNDEKIIEQGVMVGICNARKFGTGIPLNLKGNPMDGKFEIVVVKSISAESLLKTGLSKFDDGFIDSQNSTVISTTSANITFDCPRLLQLDGEVIGEFANLKIKVIPKAIQLITSTDNPYLGSN